MSTTLELGLSPHPQTLGRAIRGMRARVARTDGGTLAITYIIEGAIDRVRVPTPRPRCVTDRLWEHTCCELFVALKGSPAYHEFNFAPSGEWAAYAFARYREAAPSGTAGSGKDVEPQIALRRAADKLELDVLLRLDRLSPRHAHGALALALSVVIEDTDGALSYWALAHPLGRPDFHHPDGFALTLDEIRH